MLEYFHHGRKILNRPPREARNLPMSIFIMGQQTPGGDLATLGLSETQTADKITDKHFTLPHHQDWKEWEAFCLTCCP